MLSLDDGQPGTGRRAAGAASRNGVADAVAGAEARTLAVHVRSGRQGRTGIDAKADGVTTKK